MDFPSLDISRPAEFLTALRDLQCFFRQHSAGLEDVRQKALEYEERLLRLDPLIQSLTPEVCPSCGTVCCLNKHGFPAFEDLVGFLAMGLEVPTYDLGVSGTESCQFLGRRGCVLPRKQRPFRCTWYFCDPLGVQLELTPPDVYRVFIQDLERLMRARKRLLKAFLKTWQQ